MASRTKTVFSMDFDPHVPAWLSRIHPSVAKKTGEPGTLVPGFEHTNSHVIEMRVNFTFREV